MFKKKHLKKKPWIKKKFFLQHSAGDHGPAVMQGFATDKQISGSANGLLPEKQLQAWQPEGDDPGFDELLPSGQQVPVNVYPIN